ncbi:MAG: 16S rRNA (cytidine(1402)-2'-O)-methyltransferase [Pseudomonadota bacterium]
MTDYSQAERNGGGVLHVIATPIGNLEDFAPRARELLAAADFVAAEDTRHSGRLLKRFGIATPLVSLHEHNEAQRAPQLVARLQEGERGALVSDAGTPLVSDPGYRLLRLAREAGISVSPVPGPCAAIAAMSVAGLPSDRFTFEGFLPPKQAARRRRLEALAEEPRAMLFYESPRRVAATLEDMVAVLGAGREATCARELTKLHETVAHGTLAALHAQAVADERWRLGEFVLVVAGAPAAAADDGAGHEARRVLSLLLDDGISPKQSAALAAKITRGSRNSLYRLALELHQGDRDGDEPPVAP